MRPFCSQSPIFEIMDMQFHARMAGWSLVIIGSLGLVLWPGCKPRQVSGSDDATLSSASFIGPWVASTVEVSILSKNGSGGDDAIHYDSKQLAADQGRQPTITIFNGDGGYREEVYNLHDSLVQSRSGFWHYYADSLYMRLDVEGSPKIAFRTELQGKGLRLLSKIDWDGDGTKDDAMAVALKRP
jgi:hypothetical protein